MQFALMIRPVSTTPPPAVPFGPAIEVRTQGTLKLQTPDALGRRFVSSASGMVGTMDRIVVVSDELHEVATFPKLGAAGAVTPGLSRRRADGTPAAPGEKVGKPDLEAVAWLSTRGTKHAGRDLIVGVGSGSSKSRDRAIVYDMAGVAAPREVDLSPLYDHLRTLLPQGLNVEGLAVRDSDVLVFHRGGLGPDDRNTIFRLDRAAVVDAAVGASAIGPEALRGSTTVDLGSLNGVPLAFSDARALPDGRVVFSASAEAHVPTPAQEDAEPVRRLGPDPQPPKDGEIRGSALGVLDASLALVSLQPLAGRHRKVEGLEFAEWMPGTRPSRQSGQGVDVVLVTDPDDPQAGTEVLRARVPLAAAPFPV